MAFQEFELNMIPHGDMPSFYASQYETGRPIIIDIMMGEDAFNCTDLYIELHCRKVDDNIVTLEPDSVDGNQVTFVGTEQLFACPGKNLCELCLYADETKDTSLGSLNFFIEVEPDPMSGGLTSETQIYNLTQQIEEIAQEVIGEDYYDKTEVDDLLDLKADKATTYTKTEVDNALNLKADKSDTYTKTQTDNLLNDKADKATTYTKTQVDNALALKANSADLATVATTGDYDDLTNKPTIPAAQVQSDWSQADNTQVDYIKNKPDINAMIANALFAVMPVATEGPDATCTFVTEIAAPLQSVLAEVVATQAAGTPTPSTPLPISGHTEANITANGDTVTISFGQTVYGGVLDVTRGKLTVTWTKKPFADLVNVGGWNRTGTGIFYIYPLSNAFSNFKSPFTDNPKSTHFNYQTSGTLLDGCFRCSDALYFVKDNEPDIASMKTWFTNTDGFFAYELDTPFDIDLTPVQINAIVGENNISSDTGDTTVIYKDSIQHYIDTRV